MPVQPRDDRRPLLARIADWVVHMDPADAPSRLDALLEAQLLSVGAATAAGAQDPAGRAALAAAVTGMPGPLKLGGSSGVSLLGAVDVLTTWSMVHDYDDYMFMGHTGHSAVWVPLLVGDWRNAPAGELKAARLIANELGGRLGASLVLGPHNGQLWSPIHRFAAAAATARLLGLDVEQTTNALAISLYDAPDPLFHGFMGPDSKVRTAAASAVGGVQAALLAAEGMGGAADLLEHERGFWKRFSFAPLRGTFRGLGESWVLDTLAVKPFPGCAYVDTAVEAMRGLQSAFAEQQGSPLEPYMIDRIIVDAGLLTVGMDVLSREAVRRGDLNPVVVNFSVPLSLAVTLLAGEPSVEAISAEWLARHRDEVVELAERVELVHDPAMTVQLLQSLDRSIPVEYWLRAIGWRDFIRLRGRARAELGQAVEREVLGGRQRRLQPSDRRFVRRRLLRALLGKLAEPLYGFPAGELPLDEVDFREVRMPFPARVTVALRDGDRRTQLCEVPPGAPGQDPLGVARAKWQREAPAFLGKTKPLRWAELAADPASTPADLSAIWLGRALPRRRNSGKGGDGDR